MKITLIVHSTLPANFQCSGLTTKQGSPVLFFFGLAFRAHGVIVHSTMCIVLSNSGSGWSATSITPGITMTCMHMTACTLRMGILHMYSIKVE